MAKVNISDVEVLDTEASFLSPFRFKITFECYEPLEEDLEWRLIYVSSAYNMSLDQNLDSILVGPVPVGKHQFVFEAGPPNTAVIPVEDAVGVTVVIVACLYRDQEFIRVGYYVNNEYADEQLRETPPDRPQYDKLVRHILAGNPRITRRGIDWGDSGSQQAASSDPLLAAAVAVANCQDQLVQPEASNSTAHQMMVDDQTDLKEQQPQQSLLCPTSNAEAQHQAAAVASEAPAAQKSSLVNGQTVVSNDSSTPAAVATATFAVAKENYNPGVAARAS